MTAAAGRCGAPPRRSLTVRYARYVSEKRKLVGRYLAAKVARERVPEAVESHVHRVHNVLLEYYVAVVAHVRLVFLVFFFGRRRRRRLQLLLLLMMMIVRVKFFLYRRRNLARYSTSRLGGTAIHRNHRRRRNHHHWHRHRFGLRFGCRPLELARDPFAPTAARGARRNRIFAQVQRSRLDDGQQSGRRRRDGDRQYGQRRLRFGRPIAAATVASGQFRTDHVVRMVLMTAFMMMVVVLRLVMVMMVVLLLLYVHLVVHRRSVVIVVVVVVLDGHVFGCLIVDHLHGALGDHRVHERLGRGRVRDI